MMMRTRGFNAVAGVLAAFALGACEESGTGPEDEPQRLLFVSARGGENHQVGPLYDVYVTDIDGANVRNLTGSPTRFHHMDLSPDGKTLLYASQLGCDIWALKTDGSGQTRLTNKNGGRADGCNAWPRWSANGARIAFATNRERQISPTYDIYVMNADGTSPRNVSASLGVPPIDVRLGGWSPGGQVVFEHHDVPGGVWKSRVYAVNADGSAPQPVFAAENQYSVAWSPDGSKALFLRHAGNEQALYLMNANGSGVRRLTSAIPADWLAGTSGSGTATYHDYDPWSPDGTRVAFTNLGRLHVINADGTGLVQLTQQDAIFNGWSPDGTRIAYTAGNPADVYLVYAGGGGVVNLTNSPSDERDAIWLPRR
jgi:Tol biopolymer transport system component